MNYFTLAAKIFHHQVPAFAGATTTGQKFSKTVLAKSDAWKSGGSTTESAASSRQRESTYDDNEIFRF
jgi:hypothetical protein